MMLPETEREIRIQFLETSTEYLNKLEAILSEINAEPQDIPDKINAVLRILHSLKGSSGMLGLRILSDLAHRLEDAFQVLKNRPINSAIDADLHNLLLSGVDWLHHILELISANYLVDEHWLATFCYPLFEELYQHLGKPESKDTDSDLNYLPNPENIIHFLFQTEVEKNLQSLEELLENKDFCQLQKSAIATAKELAGLGDILNIPVFTQLCQAIRQLLVLAKSPSAIAHNTHLALRVWRRSQSLILNQNISELPLLINQFWDGANTDFNHNCLEEINIPDQQIWSVPSIVIERGESTLKVTIQQIEYLNNLCGQLKIQRQSLQSHLVKLHGLTNNLSHNAQYIQQKQLLPENDLENIKNPIVTTLGDEHQQASVMSQSMKDTIIKFEGIIADIQDSLDNADTVNYLLNNTTQKLQQSLHQVMMQPLSEFIASFPQALQNLNREYGKNVQLRVEGANILMERTTLTILTESLMHLLYNAFDHGIESSEARHNCGKPEQGLITIQVSQQNNYITIDFSDDGQGISLDKIRDRMAVMEKEKLAIAKGSNNDYLIAHVSEEELLSLIFQPGFSTCDQVTTLSGRGMGMDIVRSNIEKIGGKIKVKTKLGKGTTFTILIPMT